MTQTNSLAQQFAQMGISPQMLEALQDAIMEVMQDPSIYGEIRQQLVLQGLPETLVPERYDPQYLMSINSLLDEVKTQLPASEPQEGAYGALAQAGRGGDTMLAHINSREAEVLRRMGGAETVNPNTGLVEFKGGGLLPILMMGAAIATGGMAAPALAGEMAAGEFGASTMLGLDAATGAALSSEAAAGLAGLGAGEALAGAGGEALASSAPAWFESAIPQIGGDLASLTGGGFSSVLPQASMLPEAMTSIPGAMAPETLATQLTVDPSSWTEGSLWEDISTPFKQISNVYDKAMATPESQAMSKVGKLYNAGRTLDSMINPPSIPQRVSGMAQQRVSPLRQMSGRGGMPQPFGNRNFNQYT